MPSAVTGLILAGGAGRRVQGRDKGLLLWQQRPMIEYIVERLQPQVEHLIISCNRNAEAYQRYTPIIVHDVLPDFQGPLAGMVSAAAHINSEYVVVAPCDNPHLPHDLARRLLQALEQSTNPKATISYAHDGLREQYLFAVIKATAFASLQSFLGSGGRAVKHWYASEKAIAVDFSDQQSAFLNINNEAAPKT